MRDLHDAIGVGWSLGATVLWHVLAGPAADRFAGAIVVDMTARVLNDAEWDLGLSPEACEARSAAIRRLAGAGAASVSSRSVGSVGVGGGAAASFMPPR